MKIFTLKELRDICTKIQYNTIILSTSNQSQDILSTTMSIDLKFHNILFSFNPDILYLKSDDGVLALKNVIRIEIDEQSILGDVYVITCFNPINCAYNQYVIVAR